MENDLFKENTGDQNKNFGVMNLSIHYSLAAGLAEQLGDQVEGAVVAAVANIGAANGKFVFDGAAIRSGDSSLRSARSHLWELKLHFFIS